MQRGKARIRNKVVKCVGCFVIIGTVTRDDILEVKT